MSIAEKRTLVENTNNYNMPSTKVAFSTKVFHALQREGLIPQGTKATDPLPKTFNSELIEDVILEKSIETHKDRLDVSLLGKKDPKTYGELIRLLVGDLDRNGNLDMDMGLLNQSGILTKKVTNTKLGDIIAGSAKANKFEKAEDPNNFKLPSDDFKITLSDVEMAMPTLEFVEKSALPGSSPYAYASDKKVTIDSGILGKTIVDALAKEIGIKNLRLSDKDNSYPRLMDYLEGTSEVSYKTGKEKDLRDWILKSPDNSIDPAKILVQAVKLNGNNLFKGILCTHELLRNEARYYTCYANYDSNPEKKTAFFNKFVDIRGDLVERDLTQRGDHSGSWYRIFGTELYALNIMVDDKKNDKIDSSTELKAEKLLGDGVGFGAEAGKAFMNAYIKDWGKIEINTKGVDIVYSMLNRVKEYRDGKLPTPQNVNMNPANFLKTSK